MAYSLKRKMFYCADSALHKYYYFVIINKEMGDCMRVAHFYETATAVSR